MWTHLEFHSSSENRAQGFLFQMSSKHPFKESLLGVRSRTWGIQFHSFDHLSEMNRIELVSEMHCEWITVLALKIHIFFQEYKSKGSVYATSVGNTHLSSPVTKVD